MTINRMTLGALAGVVGMAAVGISTSAMADNAGAFIGGVFAARVMNNMAERTEAEQQQAAAAQRPVPAAAPAKKSSQARIAELDKLAAGGYITPEEYKAKKKAILDSM